jgi:FtsP/CotA-like multicopper oxidase with cupredoxin domain
MGIDRQDLPTLRVHHHALGRLNPDPRQGREVGFRPHIVHGLLSTRTINGHAFAMDRVDVTAKLGTAEIWEISTGGMPMAHPFHIHGASFRILSGHGRRPAAYEAGWKDVVLVEDHAEVLIETSTLVTDFSILERPRPPARTAPNTRVAAHLAGRR